MHLSLSYVYLNYFGHTSKSSRERSYDPFNFLRHLPIDFHSYYTNLHFHQQCRCSLSTCIFIIICNFCFLDNSHYYWGEMESQYKFIYISFMTKYIEHSLLIFVFSFMTIFLCRKILRFFLSQKAQNYNFNFLIKGISVFREKENCLKSA
jgi:hypothetical protein